MIIISNKNIENTVYFPQNIYTNGTDQYELVLRNRGTNKKYSFECEDKHLVTYDFYTFDLDFSKLPNDEYEYSLFDSEKKLVSTGLIRLNELEQNNTYYEKNNTYIAYDKQ